MDKITISQLEKIFGENYVLFDYETKLLYGKDLTQDYTPNPFAIVFPENSTQVVKLVELANQSLTGLVPSGGRTGYSGGAVATNQEIVVSFEKMNRIIDFNINDRQIKCEAGVTTKTIQDFAIQNNLYFPIDFASVEKCQIGGNIATNAGGINVIRYGVTRNWVDGLKVVTGNGELLEFNYGLKKNVTGYDLRHLFVGSEGTLGFIIEATLKLTNIPQQKKVVIFSVPDKNFLDQILTIFNKRLPINAFEFFSEAAIRHVIKKSNLHHPFSSPQSFYVLLEYESNDESDQSLEKSIDESFKKKLIKDFLKSANSHQNEMLWQYRKNISLSILEYFPYKYDIAVLSSSISTFMEEIDLLFSKIYPDFETIWFGHLGDGNLHLNILKPRELAKEDFLLHCKKMSQKVYSIIQKYKGTISAEHGIGLLKKEFLYYSKSKIEIDYIHHIKKLFDRNNIMNPGKII